MKFNKKTLAIGLIVALVAVGLWIFSTVWFINVFAVAIIISGLSLFVLGLHRLWRWKKAAVVGLFGVFAVLGLWVFFHQGTEPKTFAVPTKPEPKFGTVPTAKFGAMQKYPPYPEVWGYGHGSAFPVPEDRRVFGVWKMDNGDYLFVYTKSTQIARKDRSCCDFRYADESLQFFSGVRKDISRREIDQLRNKYQSLSDDSYQKLTFSDGSSIERGRTGDSLNCYTNFPYHMVKKDKHGKVIARKSLLYLRVWSRVQPLNPFCEDAAGHKYFGQKVGEIGYGFLPLSDDTFVVYDDEGNFIRFDKDFNSRYPLYPFYSVGSPMYLVDTHILEEWIKDPSIDEEWKAKKPHVDKATIIDEYVRRRLQQISRSVVARAPAPRAVTNAFIKEIKTARARNRGATQVLINDLVKKYMPVGTTKEAALEFFAANGLECFPVRDKRAFPTNDPATYDEAISCSAHMTRWDLLWWFWIGSDEVHVFMGIKDGVVVWTGGVVNFISL